MEVKIRSLTNRDFFTVVDMLTKISGEAGRVMSGLITSKKTVKAGSKEAEKQMEELGQQVALAVLETCYKHVREDLIKWFASLVDKSVDEYLDQMPPETTIQIIEQLKEAQETKDFFTRAWQLFKQIQPSKNQSTKKSS